MRCIAAVSTIGTVVIGVDVWYLSEVVEELVVFVLRDVDLTVDDDDVVDRLPLVFARPLSLLIPFNRFALFEEFEIFFDCFLARQLLAVGLTSSSSEEHSVDDN